MISAGALISSGLLGAYLGSRPGTAYASFVSCSSIVGDIANDDSFTAAVAAASAGTCDFIDISGSISFSGRGLLDDTLTLTPSGGPLRIGSAVDDSTVTLDGNGTPGLYIEATAASSKVYVKDVEFTDFDDSMTDHAALSVNVTGDLLLTMDNVGFTDNVSRWNGVSLSYQVAGLSAYATGASAVFVLGESQFTGNQVGPFGTSAMRVWNSTGDSHLYVDHPYQEMGKQTLIIDGNDADKAVVWADDLNLEGVSVTNHSTPGNVILVQGYAEIANSYFGSNRGGVSGAGSGGALHLMSAGSISNSYFTGNYSGDRGGAIDATGQTLTVRNSRFVENTALYYGGGIAAGNLLISESEFTNNEVLGYTDFSDYYGGKGGAVFADDTVDVTSSSFIGNSTGDLYDARYAEYLGDGGAIFTYGDVIASRVSFVENSSVDGGAIRAGAGEVVNSTFYRNSARSRGAAMFTHRAISLAYVTSVDDSAAVSVLAARSGPLSMTGSVIAPGSGAACSTAADDSSVASFATDSSCGLGDDTVSVVSKSALAFNSSLTFTGVPGRQVLIPGYRSVLAHAAPNRIGLAIDQLGQSRGTPTSAGAVLVPPPPPPVPSTPPLDVTGVAGDDSAFVRWEPPSSPGSFPVTNYQVQASPGGTICLTTATSCAVEGLRNGTTYTFRVRALTGTGWSPWSVPSGPVTPVAPTPPKPTPTITITGSREGRIVVVQGLAETMSGQSVQARVKLAGQTAYAPGSTRFVDAEGGFTWQRQTGKKTYVYFIGDDGKARSNRVVIAAVNSG